jgi:hypothetical protein
MNDSLILLVITLAVGAVPLVCLILFARWAHRAGL